MSPSQDKAIAEGDILHSDSIDMDTFSQILEMDEPGDVEFSYSIVFGFFDQAEDTFESMDKALEDEDLPRLSELGHFLKGSSATLGLIKLRDSCEKIQRYGRREEPDGSPIDDPSVCLRLIKEEIVTVKSDYGDVSQLLRNYYSDKV